MTTTVSIPALADLGYSEFLSNNSLTEEVVWRFMGELPQPVANPAVDEHFSLEPSPLQGVGMFAARDMARGEVFPVCCGAVRYALARYVNHSDHPNALLSFEGASGWMTLQADLAQGTEVLMDYNDNAAKSRAASAALA